MTTTTITPCVLPSGFTASREGSDIEVYASTPVEALEKLEAAVERDTNQRKVIYGS